MAEPHSIPIVRALLALVAALLVTTAASAQPSLENGSVLAAAERLKPGEFLWVPQVAPDGPLLVVVNRKTQRLVVYRNAVPIGISTVSSGRSGYTTPTGIFTILQKHVEHYSSIYDNAPMPYMQRLTWQGVALHAGDLPGYPASHGCIRLPIAFARLLYGVTRLGMTVVITDRPALPSIAAAPELLVGKAAPSAAAAEAEAVVWTPEAAPTGPVSIVISAGDRRIVVLRNGRLIGSAPVEIAGGLDSAAVFLLSSKDDGGNHWLRIPLPGQGGAAGRPRVQRDAIKLAESFRLAVRSILQPGTTVVLTPDRLRPEGGRSDEPLIDAISDPPERR